MNSLLVIFPYKVGGIWAFDDEAAGLIQEPFIDQVNRFIDKLTEHIPGAENGFRLIFSAKPFPGFSMSFRWVKEEFEGNWYSCNELNSEPGWLCPALFKYFESAPAELYAKAEAKS